MPSRIGITHYHPPATRALRQTTGKGTIPCSVCGRPAADQLYGSYYCKYHLRMRRGW